MSQPNILVVGTCDTKLEETLFIRQQISRLGSCSAQVMDVGRHSSSNASITFSPLQIFSQYHSETRTQAKDLAAISRNEYIEYISSAATHCVKRLVSAGEIHGVVAAGGSCGSSIASSIMRNALPIGFPKVLVSTMASGDVGPYIDNADITMMYSVTDIAGLNSLSRKILSNAAGAISGMVFSQGQLHKYAVSDTAEGGKPPPRVGITMFGVTTPGAEAIRSRLTQDHGYEVLVFHATGSGGRAMERLCSEGAMDGVIDLTTSEIPDHLVGGVLSAGPHRLEGPLRAKLPYVVSVGACDMVNFGPKDTVPEKWVQEGRKMYVHNPTVTLMRTTKEECKRIGEFIVGKLKGAERRERVKVVLPTGAVSMLAGSGGAFEDGEADEELFKAIENGLEGTGVECVRGKGGVNDTGFVDRIVDVFVELMHGNGKEVPLKSDGRAEGRR